MKPTANGIWERPLTIEGLGCVGSFGQGLADLRDGLASPLRPGDANGMAKQADTSDLGDLLPARALRQVDHFTRMALLAALRALDDARLDPGTPGLGIILTTGYGPAAPTFQFLDSLIGHGESMASPLAFSHSVHNIPVASLALKLGISGPCATICQFESSVASGLLVAASWLAEGRADRILFGAVDEHTPLLAEVSRHRAEAKAAETGSKPPGIRHALPVSEAAVFFCLSRGTRPGNARSDDMRPAGRSLITDAGVHWRSGELGWQSRACREFSSPGLPLLVFGALPETLCAGGEADIHCLADAYGNIPVAQALDLALAAGGALDLSGRQEALCLTFSANGIVSAIRAQLPSPASVARPS